MSNTYIKKANIQDIPHIHRLAHLVWPPAYSSIISFEQISYMLEEMYSPAALQKQMEELHHCFLLLYVNDEPAGFASYSPKQGHTELFRLHKLYLLPELQGRGLGALLVSAVADCVAREGGQLLELNVNRRNKAKFFYESQGFEVIREEDIPIGLYWMNDYVMLKKVAQTAPLSNTAPTP